MSANQELYVTALVVKAMACTARIEAMKVGNSHAKARGHTEPPFPFGLMNAQAKELEDIAHTLGEMAKL
mgnify:CR=1 FL=1